MALTGQNRNKKERDGGMKRTDFLSWDEYFMGIALLSSQRSKDPHTQVGACIVSTGAQGAPENVILSTGYNGLPRGCSDDAFPWAREGSAYDTKYSYVMCAELNAIVGAQGRNLNGAKIYVTLFPCSNCAKAIIQAGIKEVVYLDDKYAGQDSVRASKRLFQAAGIKTRQYHSEKSSITLDFRQKNSGKP